MSASTIRRALLAAALALVLPCSASASSLVFIKGGNVWLAAPDGSNQYQVTTDGTGSDPYYKPSQADDGTIVAVRGTNPAKLYRMQQNGALLNTPFATASPMGNLLDAEVSPDGKVVAYTFVSVTNGCYPYNCTGTNAVAAYTYSDHLGDANGSGLQNGGGNWHNVSWASSSRALLSDNSNIVYYDDLGGGDDSATQWFDECNFAVDCSLGNAPAIHDLHVSRDGLKTAWIWQSPDPDPYTVSDDPYLQLASTSGDVATGNPPAQPGAGICHIGPGPKEQAGPGQWTRPTFSPDGSTVAWSEADGLHEASATDCSGDHVAIAGAFEPFWGPADVNPGPRSGDTNSTAGGGTSTNNGGTTNTNGGGGTTVVVALPSPKLALRARLSAVLRHRVLVTRCALAQPGTCAVTASIAGSLARKLHLTRNRRAKTFRLAHGQAKLSKAGTATVRLRLSRKIAARLRHVRSLKLSLSATATYTAGSRTATKRTTLRH